jgi:hypothetical protein
MMILGGSRLPHQKRKLWHIVFVTSKPFSKRDAVDHPSDCDISQLIEGSPVFFCQNVIMSRCCPDSVDHQAEAIVAWEGLTWATASQQDHVYIYLKMTSYTSTLQWHIIASHDKKRTESCFESCRRHCAPSKSLLTKKILMHEGPTTVFLPDSTDLEFATELCNYGGVMVTE